jgi:hypothetical protein
VYRVAIGAAQSLIETGFIIHKMYTVLHPESDRLCSMTGKIKFLNINLLAPEFGI